MRASGLGHVRRKNRKIRSWSRGVLIYELGYPKLLRSAQLSGLTINGTLTPDHHTKHYSLRDNEMIVVDGGFRRCRFLKGQELHVGLVKPGNRGNRRSRRRRSCASNSPETKRRRLPHAGRLDVPIVFLPRKGAQHAHTRSSSPCPGSRRVHEELA